MAACLQGHADGKLVTSCRSDSDWLLCLPVCMPACMPQDYDDDGEAAAGSRLLHLLQVTDARNVVVVVSRWYGGILLGPTRFTYINNAARELLDSCGFIAAKEGGQKGGNKGGKKR